MPENYYEKIINMPRPVSKKRARMSMSDRAAQFAAFAALTGYGDDIREKARYTDSESFVTDQKCAEINERLNQIIENIKSRPKAEVTYFVKDKLKDGGMEEKRTVTIRRVDVTNRLIITDKNEKISIDAIKNIEYKP